MSRRARKGSLNVGGLVMLVVLVVVLNVWTEQAQMAIQMVMQAGGWVTAYLFGGYRLSMQ